MTDTIDLATLVLDTGNHGRRSEGVCVMEAAAWLAGREHSDRPQCVSPVLGDFLRQWNDALDDEMRQRLIPYIPRILDTAGDKDADKRRREMAWDWMLRTWLPAWLRVAGLDEAALDVETNGEEALPRARREASAAWAAAGAAAGDAARTAAWDAAGAAARAAARDALEPTVKALQESAFDLLDRMIEADFSPGLASG